MRRPGGGSVGRPDFLYQALELLSKLLDQIVQLVDFLLLTDYDLIQLLLPRLQVAYLEFNSLNIFLHRMES